MRILIDAGHGIDTPGKRSPDSSFLEYLWNRQVADMLQDKLEGRWGLKVSQVVTETNDIPLKTRAQRVNKVCDQEGVGNVLLLSIHSNAFRCNEQWQSCKGWSCYTSPGQTSSDELAECLYMAFEEAFQDRKIIRDKKDGDSDLEENFYILTKTRCKAVLLENFFYDNKEECKWLLKDETKERITDAIVEGLRIYFGRI